MPAPIAIFVPAIMGGIYKAFRTGILTLQNGPINKTVYFDAGNIVFASSNLPEERLDERLLRRDLLNQDILNRSLDSVQQLRIGQVLVDPSYLNEESLKKLVSQYVFEIICSTFGWQSTETKFEPGRLPENLFKVMIATPQILFEGLRRQNGTIIKQMIVDLDSSLYLDRELESLYQEIGLQPQEAAIISRLNNRSYSTRELLESGLFPEQVVIRTVFALVEIGALNIGSPGQADSLLSSQPAEKMDGFLDTRAVMEFCYDVESKIMSIKSQASHYDILEVSSYATPTELQNAFTRLLKYFHPDRNDHLSEYHVDLRAELKLIMERLTEAINILSNPKNRDLFDKELSRPFNTPPQSALSGNRYERAGSSSGSIRIEQKQKEAMEFCYQVESKLGAVHDGATHYQILELERGASREMIDAAYRRLSDQFNVRKQEELSAYGLDMRRQLEEIQTALRKAMEVLRDSYQKQRYDEESSKLLRRKTGKYDSPVKGTPSVVTPAPTPPTQSYRQDPQTAQSQTSPTNLRPNPEPKSQNGSSESHQKVSESSSSLRFRSSKSTPPSGKNRSITPASLYMRSIELYADEEYEQAAIALRKIVEIAPDDPEYWVQLGRACGKLPECQKESIKAYLEAIDLDPDNPTYPTELGLIYQNNGMNEKAVGMFQRALEIDPKYMVAQKALSSINKSERSTTSSLRGFLSKLGFRQDR